MAKTFVVDDDLIDDNDKLWALFVELFERGWNGSIGAGNAHAGDDAPRVLTLDMALPADATCDGDLDANKAMRHIRATVGDWKIVINGVITVVNQADYDVMYADA